MDLSDRTKIFLLLGLALFVIFFYMNSSKEPIQNEGALSYDTEHLNEDFADTESKPEESQVSTEEQQLLNRMRGKNASQSGYKRSNYKDGDRKASSQNLDQFFEEGTQFEAENNKYKPNNDGGKFASYVAGVKKDDDDKFNAGELLPKEENKDWFEDVQAVKVKNRHLINIYRPVAVNTISGSNRNASYDIRGAPANPRTVVSPWLMSSIEADHNIKGLC